MEVSFQWLDTDINTVWMIIPPLFQKPADMSILSLRCRAFPTNAVVFLSFEAIILACR